MPLDGGFLSVGSPSARFLQYRLTFTGNGKATPAVRGVRVIDAPEPLRTSRLRLCDLTARTLRLGLGLLGIKTLGEGESSA
jgi:hypothetical protein